MKNETKQCHTLAEIGEITIPNDMKCFWYESQTLNPQPKGHPKEKHDKKVAEMRSLGWTVIE